MEVSDVSVVVKLRPKKEKVTGYEIYVSYNPRTKEVRIDSFHILEGIPLAELTQTLNNLADVLPRVVETIANDLRKIA